jgi:KaiC/GvpD/RAD55 family RecA-like ATPase
MTTDKGKTEMTAKTTKTETREIKFPRYTLKDLRNHKIDPSKYVMGASGFMKKGACTMLVGSSGMGKSVMTMQVALCIATGTDFLGCMKVHKPRKVLLMQAENDDDILKRDIESIVKNLKLDAALVQKNLIIEHVYGTSDMSFVDYMEKLLIELKPEVVIVDPYQSYITGNMNTSDSFDLWKTVVDILIKQHDVSLLLVTHTGKPRDVDDWNTREMQYLSTGASNQQNFARAVMVLRYNKKDTHRFVLFLSKTPAAMGLKDAEGHVVDTIYVEHSHNSDEPFWLLSPDQSTAIRGTQNKVIEDTILKYPDMDNKDIAARIRMEHNSMEVSRQAIHNVRKKLLRVKKIKIRVKK